ncbi:BZ3501_MvSof-1269-A2-R1_Chr12-3g03553 [Microbotryum saponariae]|nr:BZ3501_MvSof-1269-A2-R1_Chr12-3g03553 [Microbotryum saponariae]
MHQQAESVATSTCYLLYSTATLPADSTLHLPAQADPETPIPRRHPPASDRYHQSSTSRLLDRSTSTVAGCECDTPRCEPLFVAIRVERVPTEFCAADSAHCTPPGDVRVASTMARPRRPPGVRHRLDLRPCITILAWAFTLCSLQRTSLSPINVLASPLPMRTCTSLAVGHAPIVTTAPIPPLYRRNSVSVPKNDTGLTIDRSSTSLPIALGANSTSTSPAPNSTPSANPNNQTPISGLFGAGLTSSWLKWIAVVTAGGIGFSLLFARWFCVRRYAHITVRSFFIPRTGLEFAFLRINGPPLRDPLEPPPTYHYATYGYGPSSHRQRRRDRRTAGQGISASGARVGERDEDDRLEGEADLVGERLPGYHVDRELPQYATLVEHSHSSGAAAADAITAERGAEASVNAPEGQTDMSSDVVEMPTVQEYEMATRQRAGTGGGATADEDRSLPATSDAAREVRSPDSANDDNDSLNDGIDSPSMNYPPSRLITPPPIARLSSSRSARSATSHLPHSTGVVPTGPSEDRDSLRSTIASLSSAKLEDFDHPQKTDGSSSKEDVHGERTEGIEMKEVHKREEDDAHT